MIVDSVGKPSIMVQMRQLQRIQQGAEITGTPNKPENIYKVVTVREMPPPASMLSTRMQHQIQQLQKSDGVFEYTDMDKKIPTIPRGQISSLIGGDTSEEAINKAFTAIDTNEDGILSNNEINAFRHGQTGEKPPVKETLSAQIQRAQVEANIDNSKSLNIDEFTALRSQIAELSGLNLFGNTEDVFSEIDADGSGELSTEEIASYHEGKLRPLEVQNPNDMVSAQMQNALLDVQEAIIMAS